jgi:DNA-binding NarL/FixJ family response regulator
MTSFSELTERENEVVELVVRGYSNLAISKAIYIQSRTVERHVGNIFAKLNIKPDEYRHSRVTLVNMYWARNEQEYRLE